jgi:hypothetical protein
MAVAALRAFQINLALPDLASYFLLEIAKSSSFLPSFSSVASQRGFGTRLGVRRVRPQFLCRFNVQSTFFESF